MELLREGVAVGATRLAGAQCAFPMAMMHVQVIDECQQYDLTRHVGEYGFEPGGASQRTAQNGVQAGECEDREGSGHCEKRG